MRSLRSRPALALWTGGCLVAELAVILGKISPL
jgi:hypothetical protein